MTPARCSKFGSLSKSGVDKSDQHNAEIYRWIRDEIKASRGTELQGTLNPDVLPMLFHQQACKWGGIAESHFAKVITHLCTVSSGILESVTCDHITQSRIWTRIVETGNTAEEAKKVYPSTLKIFVFSLLSSPQHVRFHVRTMSGIGNTDAGNSYRSFCRTESTRSQYDTYRRATPPSKRRSPKLVYCGFKQHWTGTVFRSRPRASS